MRTLLALGVGIFAGIQFHIYVITKSIEKHDQYGTQWSEEEKWNRK
jgi:hypothetical protein